MPCILQQLKSGTSSIQSHNPILTTSINKMLLISLIVAFQKKLTACISDSAYFVTCHNYIKWVNSNHYKCSEPENGTNAANRNSVNVFSNSLQRLNFLVSFQSFLIFMHIFNPTIQAAAVTKTRNKTWMQVLTTSLRQGNSHVTEISSAEVHRCKGSFQWLGQQPMHCYILLKRQLLTAVL